jgi:hypothetical protein
MIEMLKVGPEGEQFLRNPGFLSVNTHANPDQRGQ